MSSREEDSFLLNGFHGLLLPLSGVFLVYSVPAMLSVVMLQTPQHLFIFFNEYIVCTTAVTTHFPLLSSDELSSTLLHILIRKMKQKLAITHVKVGGLLSEAITYLHFLPN